MFLHCLIPAKQNLFWMTQICSKEILCICTHLIGQQNGMHSEIPLKSYITYLLSEE